MLPKLTSPYLAAIRYVLVLMLVAGAGFVAGQATDPCDLPRWLMSEEKQYTCDFHEAYTATSHGEVVGRGERTGAVFAVSRKAPGTGIRLLYVPGAHLDLDASRRVAATLGWYGGWVDEKWVLHGSANTWHATADVFGIKPETTPPGAVVALLPPN